MSDTTVSPIPTLREALSRYILEITPHKKGRLQESRRIHAWQKHLLGNLPLDRICRTDIVAWRNDRLAKGRSVYTIRLDLAILSHLFEIARSEWGFEDLANPVKSIRLPANPPGRDRRLETGELEKILSFCSDVMKDLIRFAIETAMRRSEILSLTWDRISFDKRVATLVETKSGGKRKVPLSPLALNILQERKEKHQSRPFPLIPVTYLTVSSMPAIWPDPGSPVSRPSA